MSSTTQPTTTPTTTSPPPPYTTSESDTKSLYSTTSATTSTSIKKNLAQIFHRERTQTASAAQAQNAKYAAKESRDAARVAYMVMR